MRLAAQPSTRLRTRLSESFLLCPQPLPSPELKGCQLCTKATRGGPPAAGSLRRLGSQAVAAGWSQTATASVSHNVLSLSSSRVLELVRVVEDTVHIPRNGSEDILLRTLGRRCTARDSGRSWCRSRRTGPMPASFGPDTSSHKSQTPSFLGALAQTLRLCGVAVGDGIYRT